MERVNLPSLPESRTSPSEMRAKTVALETAMLSAPAELQHKCVTKHHFGAGIYMRELFIPKGTTLTGKIHLTEHLNILSQGEMRVWTDEGMKDLKASTVITSKPGIKRVGYAIEDSVWITVHHNPENVKDVPKLEEMLVVNSFEELPASIRESLLNEEASCLLLQQA
jgi:quercetin dioxygenase-like cupin family protein